MQTDESPIRLKSGTLRGQMPHSSSSTADGQEEKQKEENKVVKHLKGFCPKMVVHDTKLVVIKRVYT